MIKLHRILDSIAFSLLLSRTYFSDRFRPTGSTTAMLIYLFQELTNMLQQYDYVHIISLDFSKAFDTVRQNCRVHGTKVILIHQTSSLSAQVQSALQGCSQGRARGSFVEAEAEVEAEARQSEIDVVCVILISCTMHM